MTITDTARAAALEIPPGARIPIGNPARWLMAAAIAGWQCQCTTAGKGKGKDACGRSHWDDEGHRCRYSAARQCAMRLVLAPDREGVMRLLCEPCAAGHARTTARKRASQPKTDPADLGQAFLFDLPEHGSEGAP